MAENRIDIDIEADASEAESALDSLIKKLESLNGTLNNIGKNNGVKSLSSSANKITKEYQGIVDTTGKSISKASTITNNSVKSMEGRLSELNEKYKDLGKDFEFSGSMDAVNREVERYQNALQKALVDKQELELAGKTEGDMYEKAVAKVQRYSNYIEALQKQQAQGTTNNRNINDENVLSADEEALFAPKDMNVGFLTTQLETLKNWVDKIDYAFEDIKTPSEMPEQIQLIETNLSQAKDIAENFQDINMTSGLEEAEKVIKDFEIQLEYANQLYDELLRKNGIDPNKEYYRETETENSTTGSDKNLKNASKQIDDLEKKKDAFEMEPLKLATDFSSAFDLQKYLGDLQARVKKVQNDMVLFEESGGNINTNGYQKMVLKLQQMENTMYTLTPELERLKNAGQLDINIPNLDGTQAKVSKLNTTLANMKVVVKTDELKQTEKELEQVQKRYEQIRNSIQLNMQANENYGAGQTYKKQQVELEALRQQYNDLILKQEELSRVGGGGYKFDFESLKKGAQSFGASLKNISLPKALTNGISKLKSMMKRLVPSTNDVSKGFKKLTKTSSNLLKPITKLTKMLKLMVVRMALRAVIAGTKEGFQNLAQYSNVVNADLSLLMNSLNQLKNTFAATASPILHVLTPALNYLIQVVISAMNYVNQFISTLLGKSTWTKATALTEDYASSLDDTASSASSAASAIEDMLGLQGFDELNNLTTNDDSSSSGGSGSGSSTSASDMFTEEEIDNSIATLAESIKEMWENQDFEGIGTVISTKLTEMLRSIDWDSIYKVAGNFGTGLAQFLNGLITPELFKELGNTVAGGINTALTFLDNFADQENGFDFANFGTSLSEGIVSALNGIQWDTALSAAKNWGVGIGTALNSFLTADLFTSVATTLTSLITTAVQGGIALGDTLEFDTIGTNLSTGLKTFFETFPWEDIGVLVETWAGGLGDLINTTIGDPELLADFGSWVAEAVNTAVDGITSLNINWENIGISLGTGLNSFFADLDTESIAEGLNTFVDNLETLIGSFLETIDISEIAADVMDLVLNLDVDTVTLALLAFTWKNAKGVVYKKLKNLLNKEIATGLGTSTLSLSTSLGLAFATLYFGFKLGQWLYDNVTVVKKLSNKVAKWIFGEDGKNGTLEIAIKTLAVAFEAISVAVTAAGIVGKIVAKIGSKLALKTALDVSTSTVSGAGTAASTVSTTLASKIASKLKGTTVVNKVSGALKSMCTLASEALLVAGVAAAGWNIGQAIYEAITGEVVNESFAEQMQIIGEWIGEGIEEGIENIMDVGLSDGYTIATSNDLYKITEQEKYQAYGAYPGASEKEIYIAIKAQYDDTGDEETLKWLQAGDAVGIWEYDAEISLDAETQVNGKDTNSLSGTKKTAKSYSNALANNWTGSTASLNAETQINGTTKTTSTALSKEVYGYNSSAASQWVGGTSSLNLGTSINGVVGSTTDSFSGLVKTYHTGATNNWTDANATLNAETQVNGTTKNTTSSIGKTVLDYSTSLSSNWKSSTASLNAETQINGTTKTTSTALSKEVYGYNSSAASQWVGGTSSLNLGTSINGVVGSTTDSFSGLVKTYHTGATNNWTDANASANLTTSVNGTTKSTQKDLADAVSGYSTKVSSNWKDASSIANITTKINGTAKSTQSDLATAVSNYSTKVKNNWTGKGVDLTATTKFNGATKNSTSSFTSAVNALSEGARKKWLGATAKYSATTDITLGSTNDIKNWANTTLINPIKSTLEANGFTTYSFPTLATGGYVNKGQLFIANEQGAEMVGKIGHDTTVANNRQITEGIAVAVASANTEGNSLTRQEISLLQRQNELLLGILEKETGISSSDIFSSVRKSASDYYKRTGNTAFPI